MKLPTYKEMLTMGKEKLEETMIPVRIKRARKQAELEVCDLEEKIATLESKLADLCSSKELNFKAIINSQDELQLLQRKKDQYENIVKQMFPE